ncbi:MAG: hypothetical protein WKI04_05420 [Ferruginibacter sp.]
MMKIYLFFAYCIFAPLTLLAQPQPSWKQVGELKTRDSKDIVASTWSIGGETLDRNYTDYQSYKKYLGPLGAKRIRLQGGWAKCEKVKGQYDFAWLDSIIPDAASRGVYPGWNCPMVILSTKVVAMQNWRVISPYLLKR